MSYVIVRRLRGADTSVPRQSPYAAQTTQLFRMGLDSAPILREQTWPGGGAMGTTAPAGGGTTSPPADTSLPSNVGTVTMHEDGTMSIAEVLEYEASSGTEGSEDGVVPGPATTTPNGSSALKTWGPPVALAAVILGAVWWLRRK